MNTPIQYSTHSYIRDLFVFSTFTGLSYADLAKLTWKNIITDEDGSLWISAERQKTKISFNVKLLPVAVKIIERYRRPATEDKVFPPISLGWINVGLKAVAKKCNISKVLSFHVARHPAFHIAA